MNVSAPPKFGMGASPRRIEDGSLIPGLYAAGNATAPVGGRSYPGAGASIGGAITWGHVAAKHATGWNA